MLAIDKRKKVRRRTGQVVRIDLANGDHSYGLVLREPLVAIYDKLFTGAEPSVDTIQSLPIAFILMVMNNAITSGRWRVVGRISVPDNLQAPPAFCKADPLSGELSIYQELPELAPLYERQASSEECKDLEAAAVWEAEHVEDRLRDHFAGRPNKWVQQLKPPNVVSNG